ncbi:ferritin-like domain-containing protein [Catenulispora yoronensis]|uniref:Ferritin-like domain-containing protein n=1 Tax=Catenulispora yoronensis TaxID=450799 RepID=A0ABP5FV51_9ACTN
MTPLQAALENEHAAVYGYGVLTVRLAGAQRDAARNAFDTHRARRDILIGLIEAQGDKPVAAAPAYALPFPVAGAADATRLAAQLEERLGASYADVVQASSGDVRRTGLEWLTDAAVRAVRWRGTSVAFPGLPERS